MNAFAKFDADRTQRRENLIFAWGAFRSAVDDSVAEFNRMEEGLANPAKLIESPEKNMLTVTCKRSSSPGKSGMLRVVAKMTTTETKQVAILAETEFWSLVDEPATLQGTDTFVFLVEPDKEEVYLSFDGGKLKAKDAAEKVLMKALLGPPVKASGISAVDKRARDAA